MAETRRARVIAHHNVGRSSRVRVECPFCGRRFSIAGHALARGKMCDGCPAVVRLTSASTAVATRA